MKNDALRRNHTPPHAILTRILERPELARAIQTLDAPAFTRLVRHVGLEDAGELLMLATREQIELFLDEELWRSARPGDDESFDADRFALWLEVLLEAGDSYAAKRLTEISEDLLLLGFSQHLLVVDIDELAVEMSSEGGDENEWLEKALDSCLYQEFERFRAMSRRAYGWDAVIGALLALDRDHHDLVERILERVCHASSEYIEDNGGLYAVLSLEELLEGNAADEREARRSRAGYVAPSSVKSFLALARTTPLEDLVRSKEKDPVTRAYFRELDRSPKRAPEQRPQAAPKLTRLLQEAGVLPKDSRKTRLFTGKDASAPLLVRALTRLSAEEPGIHAERMEELAYLANVVAVDAGSRLPPGSEMRPLDAIAQAVQVCERGLLHCLGEDRSVHRALSSVQESSLDRLFRIGWHLMATTPGDQERQEHAQEPRGQRAARAARSSARRPER